MRIAYPRGMGPTNETYLSHVTYFFYPLAQMGPPKSRVFFYLIQGPLSPYWAVYPILYIRQKHIFCQKTVINFGYLIIFLFINKGIFKNQCVELVLVIDYKESSNLKYKVGNMENISTRPRGCVWNTRFI